MFQIRTTFGGVIGGSISRDQGGPDWWRGDRWSPASDEAKDFDTREAAESEAVLHSLTGFTIVEDDWSDDWSPTDDS